MVSKPSAPEYEENAPEMAKLVPVANAELDRYRSGSPVEAAYTLTIVLHVCGGRKKDAVLPLSSAPV